MQPLAASHIANPDHISYFQMLGKLIGVAFLQGECFPGERDCLFVILSLAELMFLMLDSAFDDTVSEEAAWSTAEG